MLKLQKKIFFEILANIPRFLRNEKILGLENSIHESGPAASLMSLKVLPIDLSSKKICIAKFLGHFNPLFSILRSFYGFSKKNNSMAVISVSVFRIA